MEAVLQDVIKRFISLPLDEERRNKQILESVLTSFVEKMKSVNPLFKAMFRNVFYGGSFYDGLRVGKPEEFDLDLLLKIPTFAQPELSESNVPGFVFLKVKNLDGWLKQPEARGIYDHFRKTFLDSKDYLSTEKTLVWMESIVQKSLNHLPRENKAYILKKGTETFQITFTKGGPALTLCIKQSGTKIMDVDLVACFVFGNDKWPINGFRSNPFPSTKPEFFIVPKKPKESINPTERYWRLSFQIQERELINSKNRVKPTIKLLKKLRDTQDHKSIASYYIKTVMLHIIAQKDQGFWNKPLSEVFLTTLKEYKEFLEEGKIPYYWNKKNNLVGKVNGGTLQNFSNRIGVIIKDIENNSDRPDTVVKYLLTKDELEKYAKGESKMEPAPQDSTCIIS